MLPKIEKAREIRTSVALQVQSLASTLPGDGVDPKLNEDYGNTVPLGPYNIALQVANEAPATSTLRKQYISAGVKPVGEGNFDTVIVHGGDEIEKKATQLWSIYAAGNTVPIPFLRATDISPIALLSDNVLGSMQRDNSGNVVVEALQELFTGDGQSRKGRRVQNEMPLHPSVYQRLTSSSTLLNLAQALAYHKMCYEDIPLQELQATKEQQTIQNLCDTLRTILRL